MNAKPMHSLLAIVASAVLLAACNGGEEEAPEESPEARETPAETTPEATTPTAAPTTSPSAVLRVTLAAQNEVPQAGDSEMSGTGTVRVDTASGQVCPDLNITKPQGTAIRAAHIHRGAAGANGPIVVPFQSEADRIKDDCATAEQALVTEIQQQPEAFYVNVHTEQFPNGAIRGQLSR
jgi:hypothetical protein